MKTVLKRAGGTFSIIVLFALCAAAQQLAEAAKKLDSGYVLGLDDQIVIHAIDASEIADEPFLLGMNGNVTLPLIGRIQAGRLTVEQLETELNTRLMTYVSDRTKELSAPLFPGYVFMRWELGQQLRIPTTPGVLGLVGFAGVPAIIPDVEIEAVRRTVARRVHVGPYPFMKCGDWVRVNHQENQNDSVGWHDAKSS
ncbi:MAG: polysaccharide biosynthesis/export family protein [Terriglobia bacterium]